MSSSPLAWTVLDNFFSENSHFLTKHHLDSYNEFIVNKIPNTIKVLNPIIVFKEKKADLIEHEVNVYIGGWDGTDISLTKPTIVNDNIAKLLYPNEARLKDFTYQSELYCTIIVHYITRRNGEQLPEKKGDVETLPKVKIGAIPIMLHSRLCALNNQSFDVRREMGECPYDQGGYFVIDGKEKVIIAQERIATNRIFINKSKDPKFSFEGLIRCTSEESPLFPKTIQLCVYKDHLSRSLTSDVDVSIDDEEGEDNDLGVGVDEQEEKDVIKSQEDEIIKLKKARNAIVINMPNMTGAITLCVLFRALGVESDKDIVRCIVHNENENTDIIEFIRFSIVHSTINVNISSQEEALVYLSNLVKFNNVDAVKYFLINDLFPNVGPSYKKKSLFLGSIVLKLIRVCLGYSKESTRDSYIHKRVNISGFLMGNLFRDYYNQFRNNIRNKLDREYLTGEMNTSLEWKSLINHKSFEIIFRSDIIEDGLKKSLKGMWGRSMVEEIQNVDLIK